MTRNTTGRGGLISDLLAGNDSIDFKPVRIGIAGVRFQSGADATLAGGGDDAAKAAADKVIADKAAADKATADAAAKAEADKGKTSEQIAAEKKMADDKAAADKKTADDAAEALRKGKEGEKPKAPEKYELTVSDDVKKAAIGDLVADIQADVEADGKASGWTNEEAQAELNERLVRANERRTALSARWHGETDGDAEYGGANLEKTKQLSRAAVNAIFPEGHRLRAEFLRDLNGSGIGNKLTVVAFLAAVGKHFAEDGGAHGRTEGAKPEVKADKDVLFSSSSKA